MKNEIGDKRANKRAVDRTQTTNLFNRKCTVFVQLGYPVTALLTINSRFNSKLGLFLANISK